MQTIVLARHCKTDWNAEERVQGQTDRPLSPDGLRQAQHLACAIRDDPDLRIQAIITSDLKRAVQTAAVIAEVLHIPSRDIRPDQRFRECSFGTLEGKTRQELRQIFEYDLHTSTLSDYDFTEHGGECACQVIARQLAALREHRSAVTPPCQLLVVGHGRSLGTLVHHFGQTHRLAQGRYQPLSISL